MFGASVEAPGVRAAASPGAGSGKASRTKTRARSWKSSHPDRLKLTHFSPLTGQEDRPENYHTVTYELIDRGGATHLALSQDNNADQDEADRASATWTTMLTGLKETVESG